MTPLHSISKDDKMRCIINIFGNMMPSTSAACDTNGISMAHIPIVFEWHMTLMPALVLALVQIYVKPLNNHPNMMNAMAISEAP